MIFLAIIGLAIPKILSHTVLLSVNTENQIKIHFLSDAVAFLLLAVYIAGIVFSLLLINIYLLQKSQMKINIILVKRVQNIGARKKGFLILTISMIGVIFVSEILVGSVEETTKELGLGELFVGAIIVGIIGNAAEHSSAIMLAKKGKMDLSIGIAAGSGTQIALFVVPILVIFGILSNSPFTLEFTIYELITLMLAAIILNLIAHDGKSNWFEGVMLTASYIIVAIGFFFID